MYVHIIRDIMFLQFNRGAGPLSLSLSLIKLKVSAPGGGEWKGNLHFDLEPQ
jgi:hypothetical protein